MERLTCAASPGGSGTGGRFVVARAGQHRSMRLLLFVKSLVVVLLYSGCHDSHVIMAVEWKTRWKTTPAKVITEGVVVSAATGCPLERISINMRRWRSTGGGN